MGSEMCIRDRRARRGRRERGARFERREGVGREREGVGRERGTRRAVKARDERRGRRARTMNAEKRAEIYTYEAPWMIYACNWSVRGERGDGLGASAGELNREGRRRRRDGGDSGTRANGRSEIKNGDARVKTRMAWTDDVELNATGSTR